LAASSFATLAECAPRQPSALHRGHHRADGDIGVGGHQQGVGSGFERAHRGVARAESVDDRAHSQRVGDHQALEAELIAQQAGENRGRKRRRQFLGWRQRRHGDVSRHDGVHAGFDGGAERHQFQCVQAGAVGGDLGQAQVGIHRGVAVARKMFGGGQDELRLSECAPSMKAFTCAATACGFSPKERMLMMGLSGLLLTSATGA
jgi:hypothetical protein